MSELIRKVVTNLKKKEEEYILCFVFVLSFCHVNPNESHLAMMANKNEFIGLYY